MSHKEPRERPLQVDSWQGTSSGHRPLTVGSLFSGIGGFDLGFERAGLRTMWFVESEPFCQFVLKKNFPDVACYADVQHVSSANLSRVDVLAGGFPCQDVSIANQRAEGIAGARSSLWGQFARLIGEIQPRYVVIENSPQLVSRGLDVVLGQLASLGYDAEWQRISAEAVGANHIRSRLYIVAYPPRKGLDRSRSEPRLFTQEAWWAWRWGDDSMCDWWTTQPEPSRVDDGFPHRMDKDFKPRVRSLGNALVPQIAHFIGTRIRADNAASL